MYITPLNRYLLSITTTTILLVSREISECSQIITSCVSLQTPVRYLRNNPYYYYYYYHYYYYY